MIADGNPLLLAFYGDDFTGSTATLEAMAFAGIKTMLFFDVPEAGLLASLADYQAIGIAGLSRSKSPAWMRQHLPPVFESLRAAGAAINHYKVCSTFDSAPHVGSIGTAIDVGAPIFGNDWTPVFVALPQFARWQAFGNLFAGSMGANYRIDRHPVMARHPVTPMNEGDLRLHLATQTSSKVGLIDLADLQSGRAQGKIESETQDGARILLIDAVDERTLSEAGAVMWEGRAARPFVAGSQGVEYALLAHWRAQGLLQEALAPASPGRVERIAVVSGSCSPVTGQQISVAAEKRFTTIAMKTHLAVDERAWQGETDRAAALARQTFAEGRDPLIYTARGPDDPEVARLNTAIATAGANQEDISLRIGSTLGQILSGLVKDAGLTRVVVSGGDSSGQACVAMGLTGVTALAPLAPGSPLCKAVSRHAHLDGIEIALKGGQMGKPTFFADARG